MNEKCLSVDKPQGRYKRAKNKVKYSNYSGSRLERDEKSTYRPTNSKMSTNRPDEHVPLFVDLQLSQKI